MTAERVCLAAPIRTQRAAVISSPRRMEIRHVPLPEPGPRELRVRLQGCGVCASNVPPWEGRPWFKYPMSPGALGHEAWGKVDAVGDEVSEFDVGDRVAVLSNHAYADYDVTSQGKAVLLPDELSDLPFPGEPLGCAMNILRRCDIEEGQTVAIIGIGFLGALLVALASHAGARVIAISRRPSSVELGRQMGAHQCITFADKGEVVNDVAAMTGGRGGYDVAGFCDRVIECVGTQTALDLAAELCGVRGRLVIAGYHQDGLRQVNMQLWNWRGLDVINAHERDEAAYVRGMRDAIAAVTSGRLNPMNLYTHTFPLERLDEALNMAATRPDGFVKALIVF